MQGPVFFRGADVEIHGSLAQFWTLKIVESEEVGIEITEILRRDLKLYVSQRRKI